MKIILLFLILCVGLKAQNAYYALVDSNNVVFEVFVANPTIAATGPYGGAGSPYAPGGSNGISGTANTGGEGGGAPSGRFGGNGGSGVVIISSTSTATSVINGTLITSGSNKIYKFNNSGSITY